MILESILYFVLGFLSAGLLALMISPAIWNRAVLLTKRKIENSIPISLNEIQADKDQLRAEFAMSTRRLEMSVDELRAKASEQLAEISRKRGELAKYDHDKTDRLNQIRELEAKATELTRRLDEREILLEETTRRHAKVQEQYVDTLEDLSKLRTELAEKDDQLSSQRIEIAARDTRIEALNESDLLADNSTDDKTKQLATYKKQLAETKAELKRERLRVNEAEEKSLQARDEAKAAIERLEKRSVDLDESRTQTSEDSDTLAKLNQQLMEERSKIVDLEATLATQALKMEALIQRPTEHNAEAVENGVAGQVLVVQTQLEEVKSERDSLKDALNRMSAESGEKWDDERRENALLRERMNDMAAKIAVMTAEVEGPDSPVNKLLAKEARSSNAKRKTASGDKTAASNDRVSLAERIRAIQQASGS